MGQPAARLGDIHVCPAATAVMPHLGGPILPPCSTNVLIGGQPAARVDDLATCMGPQAAIIDGSESVLINGLYSARMGDPTAHGGVILLGCFTVLIGD